MILASVFLITGVLQERTAVKEVLPNGSQIYAQRMAGTKQVSLVLSVVPRSQPENLDSHGTRHLAEHFVAKGADKSLDKKLEGLGTVLIAETTRDAVTFQVTTTADNAVACLTAMKSLTDPFTVSAEDIAKEVQIIKEELALRSWSMPLIADGWRKAYGDQSVDPFGTVESLSKSTVEQVNRSILGLQDSSNLCVTVVGDIDPESMAARVKEWLQTLTPGSKTEEWEREGDRAASRVGSDGGEAVALAVPAFTEQKTLAVLAAGFGLQTWLGCSVFYNPSARAGVVTVALKDPLDWKSSIARVRGKERQVAQSGIAVLRAWLREVARDPAKLAKLTSLVLPLNPSFDPQEVAGLSRTLTAESVRAEILGLFKAFDEVQD